MAIFRSSSQPNSCILGVFSSSTTRLHGIGIMSSSVALISWYIVPSSSILLLHAPGTHLRWLLFHRPPAVLPTLMRLQSCIVWCCRRQLVASPLSALISIPLDLGRMAVSFGVYRLGCFLQPKRPISGGTSAAEGGERLLQSDPN